MCKTKKSIITFLAITFAISSVFYYLMIIAGVLEAAYGLMCCPGIAAIIVSLLYHRGENAMNFRRCDAKYNLAGLWLPLVYGGISYGIYLLIFGKKVITINETLEQLIKTPVMLLLYLAIYFVSALGEEIGWRGYLNPKLVEHFGFNKGSLITGLIWTAWHMPVFATGYMSDTVPLWYQLPILTALCIGWSYPMSYVGMKSKSVWPAAIFHAFHNFALQILMDQSINGEMRPYLVGETGIITIAMIAVTAVICTIKYRKETERGEMLRQSC